ncbi:MAG: type IX secretion system protein PorQ [Bacteroidales bacterium]
MKERYAYLPVRLVIFFAGFCFSTAILHAQAGGTSTWEFLNLTNSARVASLGGKNVSLRDGDLNLVFHNPALLDSSMNNHLLLNYVNYFTGINFGYASYAYHHRKLGSLAAGIHYINYGTFTAASESGIITGDFTAAENSVNLSWAGKLDSLFSLGATLKMINSSFEQYRSSGAALDAGINYYNPAHLLSVSLVMKNLGTQITTWYPGGEREPLPFELQLGVSKQLNHAPFRFSLLYQHLQDFRLDEVKVAGEDRRSENPSFSAKAEQIGNELLRHLILGVEFIPVSNLSLHAGYNNLRRHELKIDERVSTVGFSWGFGVQINRFRVSFGRARYHLAGSSSHFSVSTNLSEFYSR